MGRLDAWLWSVRVYKTRSLATAAIKGGHVRVDNAPAKPAALVVEGQTIRVRGDDHTERVLEVLDPTLVKRVGASVAQRAYLDKTPAQPPPIAQMGGRVATRERGAGRPTKKQRRETDAFRGR
ncbi:RNA-binding S4 domain-containing protein [Propioniciclava soli]|uniref:S4 domain-containing protein n=1 Tax=Propioniciclava soli TaxID=2775081 RepID=A0ABZ3C399_9ACTN|nr:S4 domain-containing protein [Propioniciclava soli]